jgi:hypothetical protein
MLRDFRRALSEAIAESSDVHQALRRLQEEGYGLIILLDRHGGPSSGAAEPPANERALPPAIRGGQDDLPPDPPTFRINGSDLSFLKSIGIDPTRRVRGRSRRSRSPGTGSLPD